MFSPQITPTSSYSTHKGLPDLFIYPKNLIKQPIANHNPKTSTTNITNLYPKPSILKCFKWNQPSHRSSECPLRKTVNMVEGIDDIDKGFEDAGNEVLKEVEFLVRDDGDRFVGIV